MTGTGAQRAWGNTIDWYLVGAYLLLVLLGWLNIYASEYDPENVRSIISWDMRSGKQLVWIGTWNTAWPSPWRAGICACTR